jgi:Tol biopolymer transport system component
MLAHPVAFGQEVAGEARPRSSGRIFLQARARDDPLQGLIAVDANAGTWSKVLDVPFTFGRVSPDGKRVATSTFIEGKPKTQVHELEGDKEPATLLDQLSIPCWSSDSRELLIAVFTNPAEGAEPEIWRVSAEGSKKARLTIPDVQAVQDWSPDGQWLLVSSSRGRTENGNLNLLNPQRLPIDLVRLDGTGERRLLSGDAVKREGVVKVLVSPHFSPDGRSLLCIEIESIVGAQVQATGELIVMDLDGNNRRSLRRADRPHGLPVSACWSPDGKSVAVAIAKGEIEDAQSLLEIIDRDGKNARSINLPEGQARPARQLIDWR